MKFRTIYILFNLVVVISFLFVFFMPFFLLGAGNSLEFWKTNWYLALIFLAVMAALNLFFILNWKVFILVEREDWTGLSAHLVELIFSKKRYSGRHVALLVNAYLLQSDVEGIARLETELRASKPGLLRKNSLLFGVTRLLRSQAKEAESFFQPYLSARDVDNREWLRFDYAFSLVLQKRFQDASPYLTEGCRSKDAVLALLSAYLLGSLVASAVQDEGQAGVLCGQADACRASLRKRFPPQRWNREVERAKAEIHIVILSKLIDDAGTWLYEASGTAKASN